MKKFLEVLKEHTIEECLEELKNFIIMECVDHELPNSVEKVVYVEDIMKKIEELKNKRW